MPPDIPFTAGEKMNATLPDNATALDYLKLYLTDAIMDVIVEQTNKYAEQYIAKNVIKPHSSVKHWIPTTRDEMVAFFGLCVLMGIVYKPRLTMYWSTDAVYQTDVFPSIMSRDRFLLLLRFLHFADNSAVSATQQRRDRMYKLKPIVDMIRDRCKSVYTPGRDLCVDESLLLFKGRLAFKQFIKTKRARFGIKFFELCTKNGMMMDFMVYTGDMSNQLVAVPDCEFLMSERIPLTFL